MNEQEYLSRMRNLLTKIQHRCQQASDEGQKGGEIDLHLSEAEVVLILETIELKMLMMTG